MQEYVIDTVVTIKRRTGTIKVHGTDCVAVRQTVGTKVRTSTWGHPDVDVDRKRFQSGVATHEAVMSAALLDPFLAGDVDRPDRSLLTDRQLSEIARYGFSVCAAGRCGTDGLDPVEDPFGLIEAGIADQRNVVRVVPEAGLVFGHDGSTPVLQGVRFGTRVSSGRYDPDKAAAILAKRDDVLFLGRRQGNGRFCREEPLIETFSCGSRILDFVWSPSSEDWDDVFKGRSVNHDGDLVDIVVASNILGLASAIR